jgi:hypothetical protein
MTRTGSFVAAGVVAFAGCGSGRLPETVRGSVSPLGGRLSVDDAELAVPPGSLASVVDVTFERIPICASSLESQEPGCSADATGFTTVAGNLAFVGSPGVFEMNPYALSPSDLAFSPPASLELTTKDIFLGTGGLARDPSRLDLLRLCTVASGRWVAVPGSAYDAEAQVVRGSVIGGGRYAITQICADGTIGNCT